MLVELRLVNIYMYIYVYILRSSRSIVAYVLNILVCDFKLQSPYHIVFLWNTLKKSMNRLISDKYKFNLTVIAQ